MVVGGIVVYTVLYANDDSGTGVRARLWDLAVTNIELLVGYKADQAVRYSLHGWETQVDDATLTWPRIPSYALPLRAFSASARLIEYEPEEKRAAAWSTA
jgi:hypothetical protein